ncbi:hypothetical protein [Limnospira platensis]|uniref:hypothetical protein n=1 Tax=Limnospira platensis TaxID=118562 RepID=UPI00138A3DC9|nr:hypothetical protein [Arthrospira platensis NCB002]MDT9183148.1 hypothetical protein [Limnospira sp. PMC 289.06]MDT9298075.1 hypothetical protein [Arthrospira platensis PCC 7345]MDT9310850.1 hypothetical protein [Limnospira sp. Paracas R14]
MYVDSLAGSPPTYGYRVGFETYPPPITGKSTQREVTDVIAVNGDERTDRLAIDRYHKGTTLSASGLGSDMGI